MAEDREIRQRVRVDNEASDELRRVADDTRELGDATEQSGRTAEQAADSQQQLGDATSASGQAQREAAQATHEGTDASERQMGILGGVTEAIVSKVGAWLSFTAIAGGVVSWLNSIRQASEDADQSVARLKDSAGGLAANLGDAADPLIEFARTLTATEDRQIQLVQFAGRLTDVDEFQHDPQAVRRMMREAAPLTEITDVRGDQLAEAIVALRGEGLARPVDALAELMDAGFAPTEVTTALEDVGQDELEVMLAIQRMRPGTRGRTLRQRLRSFIPRLEQVDETGELHEDLRALGLDEDMPTVDRLLRVAELHERGGLARQRVRDVLGDQTALMPLLLEAAETGELARARRALTREGTAQEIAERRLESEFVRAAEESAAGETAEARRHQDVERGRRARLEQAVVAVAARRDIGETRLRGIRLMARISPEASLEQHFMTQLAEALRDDPDLLEEAGIQRLIELVGPDEVQGFMDSLGRDIRIPGATGFGDGPTGDAGAMLGGGTRIMNVTNIRNQYSGREDPAWADVEPRIGLG